MDDARREIADGGVFIRGHVIEAVGPAAELPATADEVIDCRDMVVLPGLVNTHHHFFQTLTRAVPAAQDAELFAWLRALYPLWAPPDARDAQRLGAGRHRRADALGLHDRRATTSICTPTAAGSTTRSTPRARWACAFMRAAAR